MVKKVSVIMATYRTEQAILMESINSILNQTYENIELIIVCDGDKEEYNRIKQINNEKIRVFLNESNKGLPYSLNLAIENATGDYIARMDSDDISIENRIEKQVEFLENNKDIGVCGTEAILFGKQKGKKTIFFKTVEQIKIQLLYKATLIHPTVMVRKDIFDKYKYNERFLYAQDFELWSRISEKFNIAIIPIVGIKYRVHDKQVSIEKQEEQAKLSKEIIKNNSKKITGKYDERICKTMYVLGIREELTKKNYKEISKNIDYIIKNNKKYDNTELKKILYNRFLELLITNRIIPLNFNSLRKCFKIYNLKQMIERKKNAR